MNLKDIETRLWLIISSLWFVATLVASLSQLGGMFSNFWFIALFIMIGIMLLMLYRGSMHKGKVNKQFYMITIVWGIVWAVGFIFAQYYAVKFKGQMPSFTIMGVHPSFAWIMICYWLVGTAVLLLGFYFKSDLWLNQKQWDEFLAAINPDAKAAPKVKKVAKKTAAKAKPKVKSKAKPKAKSKAKAKSKPKAKKK